MPAFLSLELCGEIKIRTGSWGVDNSYSFGSCASNTLSTYSSYTEFVEECCLEPGTYTLECKCSHGDGWHGGYVEIAGVRYCENFVDGPLQTFEVEWGS